MRVDPVDVDLLQVTGEARGRGVATRLQADVVALLNHAQRVDRPFMGEAFADRVTGDRVVLPEVGERSHRLPGIDPGVDGDHRDARSHRGPDGGSQRRRVGKADRDAGNPASGRLRHQVGLPPGVVVVLVAQLEAVGVGGGLRAAPHHVPERVSGWLMGDERDDRTRHGGRTRGRNPL